MRKQEVPQDEGFLEGYRRGTLALDDSGRYTLVATPGWSAEREATTLALAELDRRVREAWECCRRGERSPLHYQMVRRQLTPGLLGRSCGLWWPSVWWHLRPSGFSRLERSVAERYARGLNLSVDELAHLPPAPEQQLEHPDG